MSDTTATGTGTGTGPELVWGSARPGEEDLRYEIHTADDCPNAAPDLWRDMRTAPAGTRLGHLVELIAARDMTAGGEAETDIRICRCALTGEPQPRRA